MDLQVATRGTARTDSGALGRVVVALLVLIMLHLIHGLHSFTLRSKLKVAGRPSIQRVTLAMSTRKGEVYPMSPQTLQEILRDKAVRDLYQVVDVRESAELAAVSLPDPGIIHLPLSSSHVWVDRVKNGTIEGLDSKKPTVCVCHHGVRSMQMAMFLAQGADFEEVYNLEGGVDRYALQVDPSIGTY